MRHYTAILLLSLFAFSQLYNSALWVNYAANVEEITELFCVNTDFPELNCNGKCHLKKQLVNSPAPERTPTSTTAYLPLIDLYFEAVTDPSFEGANNSHSPLFERVDFHSTPHLHSVFQPPRV